MFIQTLRNPAWLPARFAQKDNSAVRSNFRGDYRCVRRTDYRNRGLRSVSRRRQLAIGTMGQLLQHLLVNRLGNEAYTAIAE